MSRNFDLLEQVTKDECLAPRNGRSPEKRTCDSAGSHEIANDEVAKLVHRLFFHGDSSHNPKAVSFSGITREDRSSWICACAARSLALQTSASVCVVDANLWVPQLHTHFDSTNGIGLAAALVCDEPIRKFTEPLPNGNLWLMSSGVMNRTLYTHAERWRARFTELRDEFNYILINACSLARESEATLAGQLADGTVLIVEANKSRRESVRRAKDRLNSSEVCLLGAVLDQRTFPIPDFLYRKL